MIALHKWRCTNFAGLGLAVWVAAMAGNIALHRGERTCFGQMTWAWQFGMTMACLLGQPLCRDIQVT